MDVPNASLMMIENPERLGLAQLHQLRGRIGRGSEASHCVLMFKSPLSAQSKARLMALRESNDGFLIADKDLQIRGPGELMGTRQTGLADYRVADLLLHGDLMERVRSVAALVTERYPERVDPLIRRWLGTSERFATV
jgi:ATP-dependent DNA helicase RecG